MRTKEMIQKSIDDLQSRMDRDVEMHGSYSKFDYFAWESYVNELKQFNSALSKLKARKRKTIGGAK